MKFDTQQLDTMTEEELQQVLGEIQAEIKRRSPQTEQLRVAIANPSYNFRRYGKPWIAKITAWPVGGRPVMVFGSYTGREGEAGDAEIMARPGQIVRWGQKDLRRHGTDPQWGIVQSDGSIKEIKNQAARAHWDSVASKIAQ